MAKNAKDYEERPWGNFTILSELSNQGGNKDVIVKRLEVHPGKRLSYQKHQFRQEHWFAVSGNGFAVINDEDIPFKAGESVQINIEDKHRLDNRQGTEALIVIEVITGEFDEYDNERLEDDFARDSGWRNN